MEIFRVLFEEEQTGGGDIPLACPGCPGGEARRGPARDQTGEEGRKGVCKRVCVCKGRECLRQRGGEGSGGAVGQQKRSKYTQ